VDKIIDRGSLLWCAVMLVHAPTSSTDMESATRMTTTAVCCCIFNLVRATCPKATGFGTIMSKYIIKVPVRNFKAK
jgi:hypothetical protein